MRRWVACLVAVALAFAAPALAAEKVAAEKPAAEKPSGEKQGDATAGKPMVPTAKGEISKWDDATKTFAMKIGKGGREVPFVWNEKTKIEGAPKVGEKAVVHYVKEGENTFVAQHVVVQAPAPQAKK